MTRSPGDTVARIGPGSDPERGETHFDELFRAHYERLVGALAVIAGDRERAADAVQEAFVKAHLRWRRVSRYDDPIGWVRRVAINKLRDDHRRDRRKRKAVERLAGQAHSTADPPAPDSLEDLLSGLPRQQRAVVGLFYVEGATVAEIAAALGIAEGTVKSHLHDARTKLRVVIEREREEDRR